MAAGRFFGMRREEERSGVARATNATNATNVTRKEAEKMRSRMHAQREAIAPFGKPARPAIQEFTSLLARRALGREGSVLK